MIFIRWSDYLENPGKNTKQQQQKLLELKRMFHKYLVRNKHTIQIALLHLSNTYLFHCSFTRQSCVRTAENPRIDVPHWITKPIALGEGPETENLGTGRIFKLHIFFSIIWIFTVCKDNIFIQVVFSIHNYKYI